MCHSCEACWCEIKCGRQREGDESIARREYFGRYSRRFQRNLRAIDAGDPRTLWLHFLNHDGSPSCKSCVGVINGRLGRVLFHSGARRPCQGWALYLELGAGIKGLSERAGNGSFNLA